MPAGVRSAMCKTPLLFARITELGIEGDQQADRRWHGGPDKALHQFAQGSYAKLIARFPSLAGIAVPGSLGENLSCPELDEHSACLGDCWRVGTAEVQICQPRNPCTKIDARFDLPGVATFIARQRLTGWYLRVLQAGEAAVGDSLTLLDRPNPELTMARFLAIADDHDAPDSMLQRLVRCEGLTEDWRRRFEQRLAWRRRG